MSLADQFRDIQTGSAAFRQEMFGMTGVMLDSQGNSVGSDNTFACYYSATNEMELLTPFGINQETDGILRVAKTETNFVPEIGRNIRLIAQAPDGTDLDVRLVKPKVHPLGVEHVFEVKAIA
jgi:hypothetical protein